MERMWRKVNQGLTSLSKPSVSGQQPAGVHSTDTASSAGFGDLPPNIAAVGASSTTTINKSMSSHSRRHHTTIQPSTSLAAAGPTASATASATTIDGTSHHQKRQQTLNQNQQQTMNRMGAATTAVGAGAALVFGNTASSERRRRRRKRSRPRREGGSGGGGGGGSSVIHHPIGLPPNSTVAGSHHQHQHQTNTDISLKQRAVAKLKLFNFHLNWDLHMTQCKPCGPRSSGNILTRRLCRNRRNRDDNELYRSNSFKFERFERKEGGAANDIIGSESLRKKISVCDDYSLPVDFVKKRPSSFDPCLAERIPDNWASPSPLSEHVTFLEQLATVQQPQSKDLPNSSTTIGLQTTALPQQINLTPIKVVEGYSDPKDTKTKVKHRRRHSKDASNLSRSTDKSLTKREYSHLYSSDSSAPKSSEDEDNNFIDAKLKAQIPELNSPDSISEDLVKPLQSLHHKSPKRLTTSVTSTSEPSQLLLSNNQGNLVLSTNSLLPPTTASKRNPSPYYYSDLLKGREQNRSVDDNENTAETDISKTAASDNLKVVERGVYRKSNSLDTPIPEKEEIQVPKRYSITEEGVRIIRCDSPSTTTSDDSDCTECQKRRDWHAKALALVRDSCNIIPKYSPNSMPPHRFLGPAVCACAAPEFGDDHDELFRPRSIFYVHQQGADECADCTLSTNTTTTTTNTTNYSIDNNKVNNLKDDDDDMSGIGSGGGGGGGHGSGGSSGRTRQIYETAFDCKIMKSDDDLDDDFDRLTNHSILLQLSNGNSANVNNLKMVKTKSNQKLSARIKNSNKQQQQQQQQQQQNNQQSQKLILNPSKSDGSASTLSQEMENMHLDNLNNANTVSSSQLPLRGYTPSPPSTAPLPVKFPGKHERYFIMNSIKSAPNLPASQVQITTNQINNQMNSPSAQHPRLRELRLPIGDSRSQNDVQASAGDDGSNNMIIETGPPSRPRSVVLESSRVLELKRSHHSKISHHGPHHGHHGGTGRGGRKNYSSTESMATSSSGGSMESLRSSTSEGNRSTSSSESHHSTSLSSHSSDSGPSLSFPLRAPVLIHSKLHILSPISDKSSQEPGSETSDINNRNNNSQKVSPDEIISTIGGVGGGVSLGGISGVGTNPTALITSKLNSNIEENDNTRVRKRIPQNKNLLTVKGDEIQGSDSGISLQSRDESKRSAFQSFGLQKVSGIIATTASLDKDNTDTNATTGLPQDLNDLPFDMPKLRRRKIMPQQDACTSGSATSVDLGELPFDMPKLRRRLRLSQPIASASQITQAIVHTSTESSGISQASSSQSVREDKAILAAAGFRQNLTLNLGETRAPRKFGTLEFGTSRGLNLNVGPTTNVAVDLIDATIPLDRQGWYHGAISRIEAENTLRPLNEGSFLVRNSESTRQDYSLSLKSAKGFMHMRIQQSADTGQYILGQFSRPFETIPEMIRHFCLNRLPVRGAEHMCLLEPVIAQLL